MINRKSFYIIPVIVLSILLYSCTNKYPGGIGSRVFVVERASQSIAVIDYRREILIKKIPVSGDLRHASMVFDADLKYGYLAVKSGHLIRINLETLEEENTLKTSKNSIGLAISQDSKTIAISEYKPGGITLIDVQKWEIKGFIPAEVRYREKQIISRVTGMVDGPKNSFLCALMDADEIWYLQPDSNAKKRNFGYKIQKLKTPLSQPFDALISPDSRFYITGHISSRYASLLDLQKNELQTTRLPLLGTDKTWKAPPKMPHMESWAVAKNNIFMPVSGEKKLAVIDMKTMKNKKTLQLPGFPVYGVARPDQKEIWLTFSGKNDGDIQILDTSSGKLIKQIHAGKRIYHIAMTPKGDRVLVASNGTNDFIIYDTNSYKELKRIRLNSPSGIFGVWRAFQTGL